MDKTIEEILEEYKEAVRAKAGRYFILGAEKEDLIQEGMIGLVKAYNNYDPSKGASFKTFADLCINRQMISAIKAAGRQKNTVLNLAESLDNTIGDDSSTTLGEILVAGYDSDPESQVMYKELFELLANPPKSIFSPFEQQVLKLLLDGKQYVEIAGSLDKTAKQIDNSIARIRKKIKTLL